jgi:hypothetical protein
LAQGPEIIHHRGCRKHLEKTGKFCFWNNSFPGALGFLSGEDALPFIVFPMVSGQRGYMVRRKDFLRSRQQ